MPGYYTSSGSQLIDCNLKHNNNNKIIIIKPPTSKYYIYSVYILLGLKVWVATVNLYRVFGGCLRRLGTTTI